LPSKQFCEQQSDDEVHVVPIPFDRHAIKIGEPLIGPQMIGPVITVPGSIALQTPEVQREPLQHTVLPSQASPSTRHLQVPPSQRVPAQHTL
jgi:hypothetical protein